MDDRDVSIKIVSENKTLVCGKQYIGTANYTFIFAVIAYNYADPQFFEATICIFCIFSLQKTVQNHPFSN